MREKSRMWPHTISTPYERYVKIATTTGGVSWSVILATKARDKIPFVVVLPCRERREVGEGRRVRVRMRMKNDVARKNDESSAITTISKKSGSDDAASLTVDDRYTHSFYRRPVVVLGFTR